MPVGEKKRKCNCCIRIIGGLRERKKQSKEMESINAMRRIETEK